MITKSRNWFITIWKEQYELLDKIKEDKTIEKYAYAEHISDNEVVHTHVFIQFKNPRWFEGLKKALPEGVHLEICRSITSVLSYLTHGGKLDITPIANFEIDDMLYPAFEIDKILDYLELYDNIFDFIKHFGASQIEKHYRFIIELCKEYAGYKMQEEWNKSQEAIVEDKQKKLKKGEDFFGSNDE